MSQPSEDEKETHKSSPWVLAKELGHSHTLSAKSVFKKASKLEKNCEDNSDEIFENESELGYSKQIKQVTHHSKETKENDKKEEDHKNELRKPESQPRIRPKFGVIKTLSRVRASINYKRDDFKRPNNTAGKEGSSTGSTGDQGKNTTHENKDITESLNTPDISKRNVISEKRQNWNDDQDADNKDPMQEASSAMYEDIAERKDLLDDKSNVTSENEMTMNSDQDADDKEPVQKVSNIVYEDITERRDFIGDDSIVKSEKETTINDDQDADDKEPVHMVSNAERKDPSDDNTSVMSEKEMTVDNECQNEEDKAPLEEQVIKEFRSQRRAIKRSGSEEASCTIDKKSGKFEPRENKGKMEKENPITSRTLKFKEEIIKMMKDDLEEMWIQCVACKKWRKMQKFTDPLVLPKEWVCNMNRDLKYNDCNICEEQWQYSDDYYLYSKFTVGSIVWALVPTTPWWPAMVDIDPEYKLAQWIDGDYSSPSYYHVTFFGEPVTRAWVKPKHILTFRKKDTAKRFTHKMAERDINLVKAVYDAHCARRMDIYRRRLKYTFVARYTGTSSNTMHKMKMVKKKQSAKGTAKSKRADFQSALPESSCLKKTSELRAVVENKGPEFLSTSSGSYLQEETNMETYEPHTVGENKDIYMTSREQPEIELKDLAKKVNMENEDGILSKPTD